MHGEVERCRKCRSHHTGDLGGLLKCCLWRDRYNRHHVERADARMHPAADSRFFWTGEVNPCDGDPRESDRCCD